MQITGAPITPFITPDIEAREWKPATFLGIRVGESKEKEVITIFGRPSYKGRASAGDDEATSTYGPRDKVSLEFKGAHDDKGHTGVLTFILGAVVGGDRTVKEIIFAFHEPLTIDQAITEFGSDFFQIELAGSSCINKDITQGLANDNIRFPAFVYPNRGLTVVVNPEIKKVPYYYYSDKCGKD